MKTIVLLASVALTTIATATGVVTALAVSNPETIARLSTTSGILALGAIGLFFVGLATPKATTTNTRQN